MPNECGGSFEFLATCILGFFLSFVRQNIAVQAYMELTFALFFLDPDAAAQHNTVKNTRDHYRELGHSRVFSLALAMSPNQAIP